MPIKWAEDLFVPFEKDVIVLVLDANFYFSTFLVVGALVLGIFYWGYARSKDQWETVSPLKQIKKPDRTLLFLLLGAFVIKLCFAALVMTPHFDYQYFFRWSNEVYEYGFDVYQKSSFLDYPPGYLYILYVIRWLAGLFQVDLTGPVYRMMMETPVILGELLGGWVLYKMAEKCRPGNRFWLYFAPTIYLFNPVCFLNVNFWGQVDALLASLMMLSFYLVGGRRPGLYRRYTAQAPGPDDDPCISLLYLGLWDNIHPAKGLPSYREGCFGTGLRLWGVCSGVPSLLRRAGAALDDGSLL